MRVQSIMEAAALVAVEEMSGKAVSAGGGGRGRGLNEGAEGRPGRSEIAYMQHKYTPLDTRIIIITAAILVLLLSILFLNFFIRWALRRFFLLHSQKPINPNKGLSKRQVQALPSFIYSSSKPPIFYSSHPTPCCDHPNFYHDLKPIGDTFSHDLKPISSHSCHHLHPTKIGSTKVDEFYCDPYIGSKVAKVDHNPPSQLGSSRVDEVDNHDPVTKCSSLEVDEVLEGNHPPIRIDEVIKGSNSPTIIEDEVANDANSINDSTKAHVVTIDSDIKTNSPTFKGGHPIIGCTKINEKCNRGDDNNASSPAPCPICLVDYIDGDTIRVLPTCRHYFHVGCIDTWLAKSSSCPACRANIVEATKTPTKKPTLQVQGNILGKILGHHDIKPVLEVATIAIEGLSMTIVEKLKMSLITKLKECTLQVIWLESSA